MDDQIVDDVQAVFQRVRRSLTEIGQLMTDHSDHLTALHRLHVCKTNLERVSEGLDGNINVSANANGIEVTCRHIDRLIGICERAIVDDLVQPPEPQHNDRTTRDAN